MPRIIKKIGVVQPSAGKPALLCSAASACTTCKYRYDLYPVEDGCFRCPVIHEWARKQGYSDDFFNWPIGDGPMDCGQKVGS